MPKATVGPIPDSINIKTPSEITNLPAYARLLRTHAKAPFLRHCIASSDDHGGNHRSNFMRPDSAPTAPCIRP